MDNILIGSMHSKSQKLNNDCYKVVEKPSAVGRAQTGNHKNWILIWVLLLISSVNLDTLSSFFLVCHPVLKMDSQRKETRAISKIFSKCFFMSFHLLSLNNFSWWREVCSSLESPWKWGWNPSRDGLARRGNGAGACSWDRVQSSRVASIDPSHANDHDDLPSQTWCKWTETNEGMLF